MGYTPEPSSVQRYHCAVPVTLRRKGTDEQLLTSEVSFYDAFIRTNAPPPANSLVRLGFTLPPDEAKVAISAHVTQVVAQGTDHYPGFVARFVGLDGAVKQRWEALVWSLRSDHPESEDSTVGFVSPDYLLAFQARAPKAGELMLRPSTVDELERIASESIPHGLLTIPSDAPVTPGANVTIILVHPVTESTFSIAGVVKRQATPGKNEVTVSFAPLDPAAQIELEEMIASVVVIEDYDVELYEQPIVSSRNA